MDWNIFDIIVNDEKMVNLVTTFGYPFPRTGNILALKSYDEESMDGEKKAINENENSQEGGHLNGTQLAECDEGVMEGESEMSTASHEDGGDVVKVYLEPHEGREANTSSPFHVLPKQMVYPLWKSLGCHKVAAASWHYKVVTTLRM